MRHSRGRDSILSVVFAITMLCVGLAYALTEDEKNNIDIYQKLAPGVVNITSTVLEQDFFFNVVPRQGAGSGSIIDAPGYILTNHHVIEDARKLESLLRTARNTTRN